jgi:D-inositol-3-phosphate glycosyltransferase
MRIAMVSEHASPLAVLGSADAGGQNVYVAALSAELGARGHRVVVHTRRDNPEVGDRQPFTENVEVHHVTAGPRRPIPKDDIWPHVDELADALVDAWLRERPDVVHSHFWMSGVAALRAARRVGVPVVHTAHALGVVKRRHQGDADTSPQDREAAEAGIVRAADHLIATCSDEAFELRKLGADARRMSVVPCGVNVANFSPDGPAAPRDPAFAHRVVTVSRLVPRKGVDDVIAALAGVPDTELVIAGGPDRRALDTCAEVARLRDVAETSGVADRVRFLGALERHEVPVLMRSADVVVTTPWYEPFGIVPIEAMAVGVPVVASAVGGMIDTVVDDVTGVHVPAEDPGAIAAALVDLLGDGGRRRRLGAAGAARVRRRYTWARVASGVLDAYRAAIGSQVARRREVSS